MASAYITLASADGVEYYSETDAEGAFSMDVIKYGKEYTLTVSHPSYDAYTHPETISLADGNISGLAITLTRLTRSAEWLPTLRPTLLSPELNLCKRS